MPKGTPLTNEELVSPNKTCGACGRTLPKTEFHKNKRRKDGHEPRCKMCRRRVKYVDLEVEKGVTKRCTVCGIVQPLNGFYKLNRKPEGEAKYHSKCKPCDRQKRKEYGYKTDSVLNRTLIDKYGITLVQYHELLKEQGGKCKICGKEPKKRRLAVDHCHENGHVRGLLCGHCNTALGGFRDKPGNLVRAYCYLTGQSVPDRHRL